MMKINSVNYISTRKMSKPAFKNTAVPYPEFKSGYNIENENKSSGNRFSDKIKALFGSDVEKAADDIKQGIDDIYAGKGNELSYYA